MKTDNRILSLVKYSKSVNHRCFFVLIGENTKRHIPHIYSILAANSTKSIESIIWCHKNNAMVKEVENSSCEKDDQKKLNDFIKSQDIQFISYNEGDKILGQTVDLLILQDFESLTPNLIALSIETVRGGGIVVLLLDNVNSLDSLVKARSDFLLDEDFVPRYNKRMFRSLTDTKFTVFINSAFQVLSCTKFDLEIVNCSDNEIKCNEETNDVLDHDKTLINMGKTIDQKT